MRKNKLNIILVTIIMSLFSFSCKKSKKKEVYIYGTEEFERKSNGMKYNLNDAIDIYCNYIFDVQKKDSIWFYAEIIYGKDYIFTKIPFNAKTDQYFLFGFWRNGETGDIKEVNNVEYVKIAKKRYIHVIDITKKQFEENGGSVFRKDESE